MDSRRRPAATGINLRTFQTQKMLRTRCCAINSLPERTTPYPPYPIVSAYIHVVRKTKTTSPKTEEQYKKMLEMKDRELKAKLSMSEEKLKQANLRNKALESTVATTEKSLEEKKKEIDAKTKEVAALSAKAAKTPSAPPGANTPQVTAKAAPGGDAAALKDLKSKFEQNLI